MALELGPASAWAGRPGGHRGGGTTGSGASGTDSTWAISFLPRGENVDAICLFAPGRKWEYRARLTASLGRRELRGARPRHSPGYKRELENYVGEEVCSVCHVGIILKVQVTTQANTKGMCFKDFIYVINKGSRKILKTVQRAFEKRFVSEVYQKMVGEG